MKLMNVTFLPNWPSCLPAAELLYWLVSPGPPSVFRPSLKQQYCRYHLCPRLQILSSKESWACLSISQSIFFPCNQSLWDGKTSNPLALAKISSSLSALLLLLQPPSFKEGSEDSNLWILPFPSCVVCLRLTGLQINLKTPHFSSKKCVLFIHKSLRVI